MLISYKFSDWNYERVTASVIALKPKDIAEIEVWSNDLPPKELLVAYKSSNPKGNSIIYEFVHAINNAERAESFELSPGELLLSSGVYLVINPTDGGKPIALQLSLHRNCDETVYIRILKVKGDRYTDATVPTGGAKAEKYLLGWLHSLGFNDLGCK